MMIENYNPLINPKKRVKVFKTLNLEEVDALKSSINSEQVSKEFDRIFLKLLRLIKYSNDKNNEIKNEVEEDTNNLIKNLLNYIKWKAINSKIKIQQDTFFYDICKFINFFDWDSYLTKVHNSVAKTSLRDFNNKSVWEQFFQTTYPRNWWIDWMPEGWSCSYWTVLLFNFFNKLKEAWLDLDITLFRFKNLDDRILNFPSMRHSWIVVNFQWEDYLIDQERFQIDENEPIVKRISHFVDSANKAATKNEEDKDKYEEIAKFFENFQHGNMEETDQVKFFDNIDDFISHVEENPEYQKVAFYRDRWDWEHVDKIKYEFTKWWLWFAINNSWHTYFLGDNKLSKNNIINDIIWKIKYVRDWSWIHEINENDRENFKMMFNLIKNRINLDFLYDNFTSWKSWSTELVDFEWETKVLIIEN